MTNGTAPKPGRKWARWLFAGMYAGGIFWLSAQPVLPDLGRYGIRDWMEHGAEYVGFGLLVARAAAASWARWPSRSIAAFAVLVGALYGLSDEMHQRLVPGRCCDIRDWTADAVGSAVGAGIYLLYAGLRKRRISDG